MDPMLTTEDVAEFFRVDVVTVRRMISKGELTAYRVGGEYRFARADIEDYLERRRRPARREPRGHLGKLTEQARRLVPSGTAGSFDRSITGACERFTDRARNAMEFAQDEAHRLNHHYLGTEHILLGLVRHGDNVAARVLSHLGVDLSQVGAELESVIGRGEGADEGELSLTHQAKQVMELAVDEAKRLDHDYVGTEHLLLGLLRERGSVAAQALSHRGIELNRVRTSVQEILTRKVEH